jgi:hypothetical protein
MCIASVLVIFSMASIGIILIQKGGRMSPQKEPKASLIHDGIADYTTTDVVERSSSARNIILRYGTEHRRLEGEGQQRPRNALIHRFSLHIAESLTKTLSPTLFWEPRICLVVSERTWDGAHELCWTAKFRERNIHALSPTLLLFSFQRNQTCNITTPEKIVPTVT